MASTTVSLKMTGVKQALRNLKKLEFAARRRVVTAATRAGNVVIIKEMKRQCPVQTGALKRSIRQSLKLDKRTGTVTGSIKFKSTKKQKIKGQDAWYAHIVVGGSKPHEIPRAVIDGQPYTVVQHQGTRPNPFVETAAVVASQQTIDAFGKKYKIALEKEAAKLPK